jgi:hypothetical protein
MRKHQPSAQKSAPKTRCERQLKAHLTLLELSARAKEEEGYTVAE